MKLFNPVVGGKTVVADGRPWHPGQVIPAGEKEAQRLIGLYPFLVDLDEPKYQADADEKNKLGRIEKLFVKLKRLWLTLRISRQR